MAAGCFLLQFPRAVWETGRCTSEIVCYDGTKPPSSARKCAFLQKRLTTANILRDGVKPAGFKAALCCSGREAWAELVWWGLDVCVPALLVPVWAALSPLASRSSGWGSCAGDATIVGFSLLKPVDMSSYLHFSLSPVLHGRESFPES